MLKNVTVSDEKIQSAVTDYLTVNPVLPGATTEQAQQIEQNKTDVASLKEETGSLKEDLDNKIEHVDGYKEYDIGTPSVGTYWNKSAKKQIESETYQSFNPISLKAGTYHYENMSGSFTFYEDTDGNWIPMGDTSETALKLSNALTMVGADLASVRNMDFEDVWQDMASGLTGMSRAMDKYGINIRNANMQQELYNLGIDTSISKLSQADKTILRTIILLNNSQYAWGDLAKTINGSVA